MLFIKFGTSLFTCSFHFFSLSEGSEAEIIRVLFSSGRLTYFKTQNSYICIVCASATGMTCLCFAMHPPDILQSQFCNDVSVMRMKSRSVLQGVRKICWPGTSQICRDVETEYCMSQEHYLTKHKLKLGRDQFIKCVKHLRFLLWKAL